MPRPKGSPNKITSVIKDKLEALSDIKSKKIPYWITRSTTKLDSEGNVFMYASRIGKGYDREQEIEDTGFSEYFKNEDEHIDKLDAKQLDLTYNK